MAQDDVISLTISGTHTGVPCAVSMAYVQKILDPPGTTPGRDLIDSWFTNPGGPWDYLREDLSDELVWTCAVASWADQTETIFLNAGEGLSGQPSCPTTHCIQMNVPALVPHPDSHEGRFYFPGLIYNNTYRSGFTENFNTKLNAWAVVLLSVESKATGTGSAYRMSPHPEYRDANGQQQSVDAYLPYHSPFVKVMGTRRADACAAFHGGGGGLYYPIIIPPAGP